MKKSILLIVLTMVSFVAFGQWSLFSPEGDTPKAAYTEASKGAQIFMIPRAGEIPSISISNVHKCFENNFFQISLTVDGQRVDHFIHVMMSESKQNYYFLLTEELDARFIADFKKSTLMIVSVYDRYCGNETYTFDMSGVNEAYKYVSNEWVQ